MAKQQLGRLMGAHLPKENIAGPYERKKPLAVVTKGKQVSNALRCVQEARPTMKPGMQFHSVTFSGEEAR